MYSTLILDNSNWSEYKSRLHLFPLRISKLNQLESTINVKSISLKYVYNGNEKYTLGNKLYSLSDNQFVVTNKFSDCKVLINNKNDSTGICIDLDEFYFSDILHSIYFPNDIDSLNHNIAFFLSDELFSQGWFATGNMQSMLYKLISLSTNKQDVVFKDDFLKNMTYEVILNQEKIIREYNKISAIKTSTKKEIYSRLLKAKNIILDGNFHLSVKDIATMVCLSEFRFHHLFKQTFGISPLKFKTSEAMKKAIHLKSTHNLSWTGVAAQLGYSDIQTFSKVFKRMYGVSPRSAKI